MVLYIFLYFLLPYKFHSIFDHISKYVNISCFDENDDVMPRVYENPRCPCIIISTNKLMSNQNFEFFFQKSHHCVVEKSTCTIKNKICFINLLLDIGARELALKSIVAPESF